MYEDTDRYMSSWVVSCLRGNVRLYLTDEGMGTDMLNRASVVRWEDQAQKLADDARAEYAWKGFDWQPVRTVAVLAGLDS